MLDQEQFHTKIEGVTVYDAVILSQIIEKALRGGLVTGKELNPVAVVRNNLHSYVQAAIGIDLDSITETKKDE